MITILWRAYVGELKKLYDGIDHEDETWPKDFWNFLRRNELIYERALELTYAAVKRRDHFSIHTIWHVIRWNTLMEEKPDEEPFKINNDWGPYIGRIIMWENEDKVPQDFFFRRILRRSTRTLDERQQKDKDL